MGSTARTFPGRLRALLIVSDRLELPHVASCSGKGGWECLLSGQNVDFVILREGKNGYFCLPQRLMYKNRIYKTGKRFTLEMVFSFSSVAKGTWLSTAGAPR